jgi:hypothetical protein
VTAVSDAAIVRMTVADYALSEASGKFNLLGGGVAVVGLPNPKDAPEVLRDSAAPFGVVVSMSLPPAFHAAECDIEVTLENEAGEVMSVLVTRRRRCGSPTALS